MCPESLYTVETLAKRLGVSERFVRANVAAGRMPGVVKIGRTLRFEPAAIEKRVLSGSVLLPKKTRA